MLAIPEESDDQDEEQRNDIDPNPATRAWLFEGGGSRDLRRLRLRIFVRRIDYGHLSNVYSCPSSTISA